MEKIKCMSGTWPKCACINPWPVLLDISSICHCKYKANCLGAIKCNNCGGFIGFIFDFPPGMGDPEFQRFKWENNVPPYLTAQLWAWFNFNIQKLTHF